MHRRNVLAALSSLGALLTGAAARAEAPAQATPPPATKLKVVYHLSEFDRVGFVLGNIRNHFSGVGGPDHVTIALVVHGPALRAFQAATASPDISRQIGQFSKAGAELAARVAEAEAAGIDPSRLVFASRARPADHLWHHGRIPDAVWSGADHRR